MVAVFFITVSTGPIVAGKGMHACSCLCYHRSIPLSLGTFGLQIEAFVNIQQVCMDATKEEEDKSPDSPD